MANNEEESKVQLTFHELLKQQSIELEAIYRAINYIEKLPEASRLGPILENRSKHLYLSWMSVTSRHYEIHQTASDEEIKTRSYFTKHIYEHLEDKYPQTSDLLSLWMTAANPQPSTSSQLIDQRRSLAALNVKLPPLSIPTFSGKLTDWAPFKDTFESLIVSHQSLSNLEKFHYLKASVQGDAQELICNLALVETNFQVAWDLLTTRYSNTRASVNAHLNEIFSIAYIKKESASSLLNLRNKLKSNLDALENLKRPTKDYSDILINRLVERLDPSTQRDWELYLASSTECPTYNDFDQFLLARIRALEALDHVGPNINSNQHQNKSTGTQSKGPSARNNKTIIANSYVVSNQNLKCPMCDKAHKIYKCPTFKSMTIADRFNKIKFLHLCLNCLAVGHKVHDCTSNYTCHVCQSKHHTMLHREDSNQNKNDSQQMEEQITASTSSQVETNRVQSHFSTTGVLKEKQVMLATAKLCVLSKSNRKIQVRALIDQGSTWSFVLNKLANLLDTKRSRVSASLSGLNGSSAGTASSVIELSLSPIDTANPVLTTQALVIPRITTYVPPKRVAFERWPHLKNIKFSDNLNSDEEIYLLIGADVYGGLILNEIRKGGLNEPIAQKTIFGWVLSGPVSPGLASDSSAISVHHCTSLNQLNSALNKFWEIESVVTEKLLSPQDEFCESHFLSTHTRTAEGKYMVRIPFKSGVPPQVGYSRHIAERSLKRIEARFEKNPEYKAMYNQFMTEYETLHHMIPLPSSDSLNRLIVYLPHHPVFRENSQTTKLRVVFNASSKTSNGTSINDHMMIGPKLQSDLSTVLSQWRSYPIVFTADIAKMYRQILIDPRDRDYQCILWRPSPNLPLLDYQLTTVTYGTRSAPYLALRVIKQLINDEGSNFPLASPKLDHDTFVDDILFGAYDETTAILTRNEVTAILKRAQLEPRKWASNYRCLIADVDPSDHGLAWNSPALHDKGIKVLGIAWNSENDTFHFTVNIDIPKSLTHRQALSLLSQLFDPVGWISPVIIVGKILMQKTWLVGTQWDEPLPTSLQNEWLNYFSSLKYLSKISIPQWNHYNPTSSHTELHGFSDASDLAYGAVIYLKTITNQGEIHISLITSKTKVCPIKKLSIPRLELQAAVLLARLFTSLKGVRAITDVPIQCWTDSKVVLAWLSKHASSWKLFVANRVAEIQTLLPTQTWRHVPTDSNPADLASRGQSPSSLHKSILWWNGPNWLKQHPDQWPNSIVPSEDESSVEIKSTVHHIDETKIHLLYSLTLKFSSWEKTIRVFAYVVKFVHIFIDTIKNRTSSLKRFRELLKIDQAQGQIKTVKYLTAQDLSDAKIVVYKLLQKHFFALEINHLNQGQSVSAKSPLQSLNPLLMIRV